MTCWDCKLSVVCILKMYKTRHSLKYTQNLRPCSSSSKSVITRNVKIMRNDNIFLLRFHIMFWQYVQHFDNAYIIINCYVISLVDGVYFFLREYSMHIKTWLLSMKNCKIYIHVRCLWPLKREGYSLPHNYYDTRPNHLYNPLLRYLYHGAIINQNRWKRRRL